MSAIELELPVISDFFDLPPYGLPQSQKAQMLVIRLRQLCWHHYERCVIYRRLIERVFGGEDALNFERLEEVPFIPVPLFKTHALRSVPAEAVVRTLASSGTSGQVLSRVELDRETSQRQTQVLVKILQHFLGPRRSPMVIFDRKVALDQPGPYPARVAALLGMMPFGRDPFFALKEDLSLDIEGLSAYLARASGAGGERVVVFGLTAILWQALVLTMEREGKKLHIPQGVLIHAGGWKKLQDAAVGAEEFRQRVQAVTGISRILNFYGMVEQVGSIFFENPRHYLQAPVYAEVIIRDPITLRPLPVGGVGLVQVLSAIPTSYPGHSLLTEDMGVLRGVDDPTTGMNGRYFEILGRVPQAEVRGCSDTYPTQHSTT